jgi:RHS repeat-associated protein
MPLGCWLFESGDRRASKFGTIAIADMKTVNTTMRDGLSQAETTTQYYDLLGRMDYTEIPNSVVEDYTFDNMDRLDVMRHYLSDANNANLSDNALRDMFDYSYRADGKRTSLVETFGGTGVGPVPVSPVLTNNYAWSYDNAGRLTSEILDSSDNTVDQAESYIMDLVGNRIRRTIDKPNTANDVTDIYTFDSSDRLQTENRYSGLFATGTPTGSATQTTGYSWSGTQQTSKVVVNASSLTPQVSSLFKYGLMGQLEGVITETKNGTNAVTARTQVEYRYDTSGLRFVAIDSSDSNLATPVIDRVENGRTEYLLDHMTMTGYGQTIIETLKNAAGQATKRTSYTFGMDEITQTVSDLNPTTGAVITSETLTFGHDGHGSVRALFGAAAALVQVFTYSAYGEFLAIHSGAGVRDIVNGGSASTLANPAGAKTSILYNGEGIDNRTGLYNFRARWYSASNGRFERLDPFAGSPNDPSSFNKYGMAHGNPVMGTDPTGMWLGAVLLIGLMGAAFSVAANGLHNWSHKKSFFDGSWEAARNGAILGVTSALFPAVGLGLALFGILDSLQNLDDVMM